MTDQELHALNERLEQIYIGNSVTTIWSPTYWDTLREGIAAGLVREDSITFGVEKRRRYTFVTREVSNILEGNLGQAKKAS